MQQYNMVFLKHICNNKDFFHFFCFLMLPNASSKPLALMAAPVRRPKTPCYSSPAHTRVAQARIPDHGPRDAADKPSHRLPHATQQHYD